jgi:phage tail sheath protein FI
MKAETKAKRRVTLSICGLNMLDESEVESIPQQAKQVTSVVSVKPAQVAVEQNRQQAAMPEPTMALNFDDHTTTPEPVNAALTQTSNGLCNPEYVIPIGKKYKGMMIKDVDPAELESFCNWLIKDSKEKGKPLSGNASEMVENVTAFLGSKN